jgi:glycine/D-amino acid oxidase-like deaminating enzyme/nitrite reductase/ring-hydroxylating ferredoxin subunit
MATRSIWMAETALENPPRLDRHLDADIVVVGAGIAGLTAAYQLARTGRSVVILDKGPIAGGMTGRTTAHLSDEIDDRCTELIRLRGAEESRRAVEAHGAAISFIEEVQEREGFECLFARVDGYLFLAPGQDPRLLEDELAAATRLGLRAERVACVPLPARDCGPALRFPRQARFHPLLYANGLAACIRRDGGAFFTARVTSVTDGERVVVATETGARVTADAAVVATNSPINDRIVTHTKQAPYRTFAIAARLPDASLPDALYWDMANPYHYVRLHRDWVLVGGEDHKTGQAEDSDARFGRLEAWARERFPLGAVEHRWSGQVLEPVDGLGFLGRNPGERNVYIATGDSGMGMTHGTIAGTLIADLVAGKANPFEGVFSVSRATPKAIGQYVRENVNVAVQFKDYIAPGERRSAEALGLGEGAVLRRGLKLVAAYRDEQGRLHERAAVCTHLGCPVHWNALERCWDCPCHGSQFAPDGTVLNGPAVAPLASLGDEAK